MPPNARRASAERDFRRASADGSLLEVTHLADLGVVHYEDEHGRAMLAALLLGAGADPAGSKATEIITTHQIEEVYVKQVCCQKCDASQDRAYQVLAALSRRRSPSSYYTAMMKCLRLHGNNEVLQE